MKTRREIKHDMLLELLAKGRRQPARIPQWLNRLIAQLWRKGY